MSRATPNSTPRQPRCGNRHLTRGFTLFEMVIVMGIAAILAAIAIPSYKYVTTANRIASEINALVGDLQFARSEAIKQGQNVTVCISSGGTACTGNASNTAWNTGWIVFADVNGSASVDAGDTVLRVQRPLTGTDTFTGRPDAWWIAPWYITFNREGFAGGPSGFSTSGGGVLAVRTQPVNDSATRCIAISYFGAIQVLTNNGLAYDTNYAGFGCS